MTEAERQAILSSAKTFFRTRIAENHKANTEKLTSLSKFNINPFTHKYLAQFAFGDSSPESIGDIQNQEFFDFSCIYHKSRSCFFSRIFLGSDATRFLNLLSCASTLGFLSLVIDLA